MLPVTPGGCHLYVFVTFHLSASHPVDTINSTVTLPSRCQPFEKQLENIKRNSRFSEMTQNLITSIITVS